MIAIKLQYPPVGGCYTLSADTEAGEVLIGTVEKIQMRDVQVNPGRLAAELLVSGVVNAVWGLVPEDDLTPQLMGALGLTGSFAPEGERMRVPRNVSGISLSGDGEVRRCARRG